MEKLFYIDSYIKNFTAEIKEIKEVDSKYHVLLNKTAFFPGGGGQYCDLGIIDNINVLDVYEENDKIYHVLDKKPNRIHKVKCEIDWDRREYGMQHHLGQHIISACFNNEYKAKTVGFHLGNEASTVDIEGFFKEEDILKIENMCNEIIRENIEFNSLIPELSVSNMHISKKFYMDLGFQVRYERKEDKFCFLQLEENQIMIEEDNNNWNTGKLEYPYGRGINISMTISDVEKMYNKLKEKDIKFFLDLEVHEYRVNDKISLDKEFLVQDPDGYLLRFNN